MSKRRWGDRRDGKLIRNLDALHFIMGVIYPNRADNEAYISERVDLSAIKAYLEERNQAEAEQAQMNGEEPFPYTFFHIIVAAALKTVLLRPHLNRFIVNGSYYQRNQTTAAFVVKKQFDDKSEERMAFVRARNGDSLEDIHNEIKKQVRSVRRGKDNSTDQSMDFFNKMPRFISKLLLKFVMFLDRHGWVPEQFIRDDPNYSSVFLTNLGSIKLRCGYHHLSNWGTASIFCVIGEKKWTPRYDRTGFIGMRETLDLGLTVDERIADGYYFSRSVRLLKYLLEHPDLLDLPLASEVEYE